MNREKDRTSYIYWRLGQAGIPFDQVGPMMGYALKNTRGHEPGYYSVPGTDMEIFWDPGIDGYDGWYGLKEPVNQVHTVKPLDAHEDTWRCSCGEVFEIALGFVICPKDRRTGNAVR